MLSGSSSRRRRVLTRPEHLKGPFLSAPRIPRTTRSPAIKRLSHQEQDARASNRDIGSQQRMPKVGKRGIENSRNARSENEREDCRAVNTSEP
eukprot:756071-Hanusia_phi.AAC.9